MPSVASVDTLVFVFGVVNSRCPMCKRDVRVTETSSGPWVAPENEPLAEGEGATGTDMGHHSTVVHVGGAGAGAGAGVASSAEAESSVLLLPTPLEPEAATPTPAATTTSPIPSSSDVIATPRPRAGLDASVVQTFADSERVAAAGVEGASHDLLSASSDVGGAAVITPRRPASAGIGGDSAGAGDATEAGKADRTLRTPPGTVDANWHSVASSLAKAGSDSDDDGDSDCDGDAK